MTDSGESAIINFQPMPKRFMVWDKEEQKFLSFIDDDGYEHDVTDICTLALMLDEYGYSYDDVAIVQSTNLFDKDGKEVFEGSVVDFTYWQMAFTPDQERRRTIRGIIGCDSLGHYIQRIGGSVKLYLSNYANYYENETEFYNDFAIVDHVLSNPELLEEYA